MLREFLIITALTVVGSTYSLISGLAPLPWAAPELEAGEIRLEDAQVLHAIWVDAREQSAFTAGHAPGAIFYDSADTATSMGLILEQWLTEPRPIIVYCADEGCGTSKRIADALRDNLPDAEIYSLKGGWSAWDK